MARKNFLAFSSLAAALVFSAGSLAAPMPQEQFDALLEQYDARFAEMRASGELTLDSAYGLQAEFSPKFPIGDLTMSQLRTLGSRNLITSYKPGSEIDRTQEAILVLDPFTSGDSVDAVEALAFKARMLDSNNEESQALLVETVGRVLGHKALPDALRENRVESIWMTAAYGVPEGKWSGLSDEIAIAAARFPADAAAPACSGITMIYEKAAATDDAALKAGAEQLRLKAVAALTKIMESDNEEAKRFAKRELASLEAAPRIAKLVGNMAPELDFTWSSGGETLRNLADLRGKVVILDFWATWCGPCIGSFPQVRELAAHYAGYPVEIVGVTSLQGATFFEAGKEEAETPADEHNAMPRFMEEKDITWTVAFSEQDVFNPEYGIRGIPHVVIIDPDGKITHRALHPASPLEKKTALIDPILEQFGFERPAAPVAKEETKGGE
jgi:thiol-disulfide isomerase/thioredoxin